MCALGSLQDYHDLEGAASGQHCTVLIYLHSSLPTHFFFSFSLWPLIPAELHGAAFGQCCIVIKKFFAHALLVFLSPFALLSLQDWLEQLLGSIAPSISSPLPTHFFSSFSLCPLTPPGLHGAASGLHCTILFKLYTHERLFSFLRLPSYPFRIIWSSLWIAMPA
jgi:hypothetical protein